MGSFYFRANTPRGYQALQAAAYVGLLIAAGASIATSPCDTMERLALEEGGIALPADGSPLVLRYEHSGYSARIEVHSNVPVLVTAGPPGYVPPHPDADSGMAGAGPGPSSPTSPTLPADSSAPADIGVGSVVIDGHGEIIPDCPDDGSYRTDSGCSPLELQVQSLASSGTEGEVSLTIRINYAGDDCGGDYGGHIRRQESE